MKVVRKLVILTLSVPVKVGNLVADMEYQMHIFEGKNGKAEYDLEWTDILEVFFEGVRIENYRKFEKFHSEMGINYDKLLQEKAELQLTPIVLGYLLELL